MREVLIRLGILEKLVNLVQVYLKDTGDTIGDQMSKTFNIYKELKKGDELSPFLFNLVLECSAKEMQTNENGLQLNGIKQLLTYTDDIALLWNNKDT
ncbi:hypothetical protein V1477_019507 [Vespula maculifrons]|uniref:Reverse transcriptase domain-containing protein n=1 Tax=Vespula maculifrons TaxID=7453 RepID=A0ABD2AR95_VESMC